MDEMRERVVAILIILLLYHLGEFISSLLSGVISPSVAGMILLFTLLSLKVIKPASVEWAAKLLLDNLMLFFIPVTVGVALLPFDRIKGDLVVIVLSIVLSSLLVIWVVGAIMQKMERRK